MRTAKSAERKMLCEAMRRLSVFDAIENYRYIGLGSTYFSDFSLIHKMLGIEKMVSIEKDQDNSNRFDFNRPYSCIKMEYGLSEDVLPNLNWQERSILWLDYDDRLLSSMLTDINTFISNATSGSLFILTCNAQADAAINQVNGGLDVEKTTNHRIQELEKRIGRAKIPAGLTNAQLTHKTLPKLYYKILIDEINEQLALRNIDSIEDDIIEFVPLFNFLYKDGAQMLTMGGLVVKRGESNLVQTANFDSLSFIKRDENAFNIDIPNLTYKEIKYLDYHLHAEYDQVGEQLQPTSNLAQSGIPIDDIKKYAKIYRYFSSFAESIF
ncbi:O-methyltransferase [Pedobacter sp. GR22-6]|uniref:O-methyltransferase n=1 Tax=Pedobacter sp. GR22-6 TaxID=3127957 RepID=UPI00307E131F